MKLTGRVGVLKRDIETRLGFRERTTLGGRRMISFSFIFYIGCLLTPL